MNIIIHNIYMYIHVHDCEYPCATVCCKMNFLRQATLLKSYVSPMATQSFALYGQFVFCSVLFESGIRQKTLRLKESR